MRPLLLLLTTCAVLAAVPSTTVAKGIAGVEVCGADGCRAVDAAFFHAAVTDGDPLGTPVAAAPFVTLKVQYHDAPREAAHTERFTYLPSLGLVRPQGAPRWIRLYPGRRGELDKIVAPITPLPAAQLSGAAQPAPDAAPDDPGAPWLAIIGAVAAALALLALLARHAMRGPYHRLRSRAET